MVRRSATAGLLAEALNALRIAVLILDKKGRIRFANGSAERISGNPPYPILVQPLKRAAMGTASVSEACSLYVTNPDDALFVSEEAVSTMFGLTPAEARLATALLRWPVLRVAAEELGITDGTARQVLKRVFRKTAAQSQASLVMLLVNSGAVAVSSEPLQRCPGAP